MHVPARGQKYTLNQRARGPTAPRLLADTPSRRFHAYFTPSSRRGRHSPARSDDAAATSKRAPQSELRWTKQADTRTIRRLEHDFQEH
jgi:hypothetical protein